MMNLKINGQDKQMCKGLNITELLNERNVESPEMVSVELNERILRKEDFSTTLLQDGDQIEFLYFMGGGEHHNDGFQP